MDPINYLGSPQPVNPLGTFTQGLQVGTAIQQQQAAAEQARVEAERQKAISEAFTRLQQPGATAKDYANLAMVLPKDQSESVLNAYKTMSEAQAQSSLRETGQVFAALSGGRSDVAADLLKRQADAFRNLGDDASARYADALAQTVSVGDQGAATVRAMLGYSMSQMPGGKDAIDSIVKLNEDARTAQLFPTLQAQKQAELDRAKSDAEKAAIEAKYAERFQVADLEQKGAQLGLTKAQVDETLANTSKLDAETRRILLELEAAAKSPGGLTPEKAAQGEDALRKELYTDGASFRTIQANYDILKTADATGIGDVARIFAIMKMYDPTSVVREGEQATAANASGVPSAIIAQYNKLIGGGALSPQARKEFEAAAEKVFAAAKTRYAEQSRVVLDTADRRGFNLLNIAPREELQSLGYGERLQAAESRAALSDLRSFILKNNPGTKLDVGKMSEDEIKASFPNGYKAFSERSGYQQTGATVEVNY